MACDSSKIARSQTPRSSVGSVRVQTEAKIIEVPALSSEQALQVVPRRLSNPTAEVKALSVGEAKDDDCHDEYEGESSSFT